MSQSGSRGRGIVMRYRFEGAPILGPTDYSTANLEDFVKASGKEYVDEMNRRLERERGALRREGLASSSTQYRQALQRVRFDYVTELNEQGLLRNIPQGGQATTNQAITLERVTALFNSPSGGRTALLELVTSNPAANFNANALRQAATLLGVKGVATATKGKRENDLKQAIRDLILGKSGLIQEQAQTEEAEAQAMEGRFTQQTLEEYSDDELRELLASQNLDSTGTRTALIRRILSNQAAPAQVVKYSNAVLQSYKVDQLKNILRNLKLKISGTKPELIERILGAQGEAPTSNVDQIITDIISSYNNGDIGLSEARERAREVSPDVYNKATVMRLREFLRLLGLDKTIQKAGTTATKAEIIRAITGGVTSTQLSQDRRRTIQTNLALCEQSTDEELRRVAQELNIDVRGMDKRAMCEAIHENYLNKFSSLLITELSEGTNSLANLARMDDKSRTRAIQTLARRAGYQQVSSLQDLMREFLLSHYRSRALRFAPDTLDAANAFLNAGEIVGDEITLGDMARIFADINPDLLSLAPQAQADALDELYKAFILPVMQGDEGSSALLERQFGRFSYSPARRNRGVLAGRLPAPQQQQAPFVPAPQSFIPEEPLDEDEDEDEEFSV